MLGAMSGEPKAAAYADMLRSKSFNIFYDAGTLVVIGVRERTAFSEADGWLAAQNLMLKACELGLGSCCIGFAVSVLNLPDEKQALGIPAEGAVIVALSTLNLHAEEDARRLGRDLGDGVGPAPRQEEERLGVLVGLGVHDLHRKLGGPLRCLQ